MMPEPAILQPAALGRIDHYVAKPVFAPDERFHRAITEFLDEWWRVRGQWFEVFRIVGDERSTRSHELRDLYRNGLPFGFYPVKSDRGRAVLEEVGAAEAPLPVVVPRQIVMAVFPRACPASSWRMASGTSVNG
jgi:hypothetical protein